MLPDPDRIQAEADLMCQRHGRTAPQMVVSRIVASTRSGGPAAMLLHLQALSRAVERRSTADYFPYGKGQPTDTFEQRYPISRLAMSDRNFAALAERYAATNQGSGLADFLAQKGESALSEIARFDEGYTAVAATHRTTPLHLAQLLALSEDRLLSLWVERQSALAAWELDAPLPQPVLDIHPDLINARAMMMVGRSDRVVVLPITPLEVELLNELAERCTIEQLLARYELRPRDRSPLDLLCVAIGHEAIVAPEMTANDN